MTKREQMLISLRDPIFRKQLIDEHINVGLSFQIRSLRNRQKMTQTKLAELLGDKGKQPLISEWENPNYGKYTLQTLKEFAKVFDVGLLVRFVPFSTLVDWAINPTSDTIAPPNYGEEQNRMTIDLQSQSTLVPNTANAVLSPLIIEQINNIGSTSSTDIVENRGKERQSVA